jgi:hypothetical protein
MKNIEQRTNELRREAGRMFRKLQSLYIDARRAERLRNVFALTAASTPRYCEEPLAQTGVAAPPSALNTILLSYTNCDPPYSDTEDDECTPEHENLQALIFDLKSCVE